MVIHLVDALPVEGRVCVNADEPLEFFNLVLFREFAEPAEEVVTHTGFGVGEAELILIEKGADEDEAITLAKVAFLDLTKC